MSKPDPAKPRKDRFANRRGDVKIIHFPACVPSEAKEKKVKNGNHIDAEDLAIAVRPILERVAKRQGVIFYGALAQEVKSHKFATPAWQGLYGHNKRLWQALYKVSRDSNDRNEFFLSAVVVHKDDGIPGKAFIEWCDEETPGRNWAWHMKAAHKYYRFR